MVSAGGESRDGVRVRRRTRRRRRRSAIECLARHMARLAVTHSRRRPLCPDSFSRRHRCSSFLLSDDTVSADGSIRPAYVPRMTLHPQLWGYQTDEWIAQQCMEKATPCHQGPSALRAFGEHNWKAPRLCLDPCLAATHLQACSYRRDGYTMIINVKRLTLQPSSVNSSSVSYLPCHQRTANPCRKTCRLTDFPYSVNIWPA